MTQESPPAEITRLLDAAGRGDDAARGDLLNAIYEELHRLASAQMVGERDDHTLQPTALVHEVYLRLMAQAPPTWDNRAHFFGAAAEAMRRILIDHARARQAAKRGGDRRREPLDDLETAVSVEPERLLSIDAALSDFEKFDPEKAKIVRLRFFAGLSVEEIARVLDVSERTVKRRWRFAKAWLYRRLSESTHLPA